MPTAADVRRIAMALPGAEKVPDRFAFGVRTKGQLKEFAWVWMERVDPKKARVPNTGVIAIRVENLAERDRLLAEQRPELFTEPHYEGYPAVLVRLDLVRLADLEALLADGWRSRAPRDLTMLPPGAKRPARRTLASRR